MSLERATLTQYRHASSLAGEVQQCQQLILASDSQLRDNDKVSCPGKKDPAQLPGCANKRLLIWGCSLVNWSLWRNAVNTQGEGKHVVFQERAIVPVRNLIHKRYYIRFRPVIYGLENNCDKDATSFQVSSTLD